MNKYPSITKEIISEHGISDDEYCRIKEILKREPNFVELGIFSVMWSEHCSYKSSIKWLKKYPRSGDRMLVDAGEENAGLIDIGDDLGVAFKIESHNHPSAVEPYEGAATGVGGIMRDIFTMGARPIASMNSLRFGPLDDNSRNRFLLEHVVEGIADYGNCLGIPVLGGEVVVESAYSGNPLVNAFSLGVVKKDNIAESIIKANKSIGAKISIESKLRTDELLFGECQSVIIATINPKDIATLTALNKHEDIHIQTIGKVTDNSKLSVNDLIDIDKSKLESSYFGYFSQALEIK